ncbi:rodlin [Streptomyces sp. NPDC006283]|uniref:rodlin n=1 Tax=Streptomyces sp. NPDC006283 TaxID=3156741 RepID=UPI0033BD1400
MIKKILTTAMVTASMVGAGATMAPQALALGNDGGTNSASGNGASQIYGNAETYGAMSPQMSLIQGSLNKPCIGLPAKANVGSLIGIIPVAVQDVPILSAPQTQQCTENSTQAKGDEPLSHILSDIPVLSGNGADVDCRPGTRPSC